MSEHLQEYHRRWHRENLELIDANSGKLSQKYGLYRECPLCGSDNATLLFTKSGFDFVRCRSCTFVYVNPIVDENRISNVHVMDSLNYLKSKIDPSQIAGKWAERILNTLGKHKLNGRLLDVGCSTGLFLRAARNYGWEVMGIEMNEAAARKGRETFGVNVVCQKFEDASLPSNHFDVVTFHQVLEHLPTPLTSLRKAHWILKPGGVVFVGVPNIDSFIIKVLKEKHRHFAGKGHINYFDPTTLRKMIQNAGFSEIVRVQSHGEECTPTMILRALINPVQFDFFSPNYFQKERNILHRLMNEPTSREARRSRLAITLLYRMLNSLFIIINYPFKTITNWLKKGSYLEIYARK